MTGLAPPPWDLIETAGDYQLVLKDGQYWIVGWDGSTAALSYQGSPFTPTTFPGWSALHVEANDTGGFYVLVHDGTDNYGRWVTDASGAYLSDTPFPAEDLVNYEVGFRHDLNGDGQIGPAATAPPPWDLIETAGDYQLVLKDGQYWIVGWDGSTVALSYQGNPTDPTTFPGWSALHVEANDTGGFYVLWHDGTDNYGRWVTDASGAYLSDTPFPAEDLVNYEVGFRHDLNGDGQIGPAATAPPPWDLIETAGDYQLVLKDGQYWIVGWDGSTAALSYQGSPFTPTTFPGWSALHVEANDTGGFYVLVHDGTDNYGRWVTDASGAYLSDTPFPTEDLVNYEVGFRHDLNGDGQIGPAATAPPPWDLIETAGDYQLVLKDGQYWIVGWDGSTAAISYQGSPFTPTTFPGWSALHVEANDTGGFYVLVHDGTDNYGRWVTDASGAYLSDTPFPAEDLVNYEVGFRHDLNGDGQIGPAATAPPPWDLVETAGDYQLVLKDGQYWIVGWDGSTAALSYQGSPFTPTTFPGWSALHVEANDTGGFYVLVHDGADNYGRWVTDASGAYLSDTPFPAEDLVNYEVGFRHDLNGDGQIGPAAAAPPPWDLIETAGDYQLVLKDGQYWIVGWDGSTVALSYQGSPTDPTTFPGWSALHVEANDTGGFYVLWHDGADNYGRWVTDASGAYLSDTPFPAEDLVNYEVGFRHDLNGDGQIGPAATAPPPWDLIETAGDYQLVLKDGQYWIVGWDGSTAALSYQGSPFTPTTFPGWSALHVEANDTGGFYVLVHDGTDNYGRWVTDASGAYLSDTPFPAEDLVNYEVGFRHDLNGDGQIGPAATAPPPWDLIETAGDYQLVLKDGQYWIVGWDGSTAAISYQGSPFTPTTFPGWSALHVEANDTGGFYVLVHDGTDNYGRWVTDASGAYLSDTPFPAEDLVNYEVGFRHDLNGDGQIGPAATAALIVGPAGAGSALAMSFGGSPRFDGTTTGDGNDSLLVGGSGDALDGSAGDRAVHGEAATDLLVSDTGGDTFVFPQGDGLDTASDFMDGQDTLNFADYALLNSFADEQAVMTQSGGNAPTDTGLGDQITLQNVFAADLTAEDVLFV